MTERDLLTMLRAALNAYDESAPPVESTNLFRKVLSAYDQATGAAEKPASAPFFETMTTCRVDDLTVRVWAASPSRVFGPNVEILSALEKLDERRRKGRLTFPQLCDEIERLPGVAAYEVTDGHGQGAVVYLEWP